MPNRDQCINFAAVHWFSKIHSFLKNLDWRAYLGSETTVRTWYHVLQIYALTSIYGKRWVFKADHMYICLTRCKVCCKLPQKPSHYQNKVYEVSSLSSRRRNGEEALACHSNAGDSAEESGIALISETQ